MSSDKASALRAPAASPTPALSPIVQLLPTGYRDIQPFQRGQGWHSNGKATAKLRHAREASERVVFPVIATSTGVLVAASGPLASVVDGCDASLQGIPPDDGGDDRREREEAERRALSPPASAIPVPPSRPRRPSSGAQAEGNQRASSGSFRTRAIAASIQSGNDLHVSTASATVLPGDEEDDVPPPDPATMEKLWQEYNERTKHPTKTVDRETYHRKMQHRYNETKALRERIARLEMELEDARRERDEALDASLRSEQRAVMVGKAKDIDDDPSQSMQWPFHEVSGDDAVAPAPSTRPSPRPGNGERTFASVAARLSMSEKLQQQQPTTIDPEEVTYREKCFKLERVLATAKEGIAQLQARLMAMHDTDHETIECLRAQLDLERQASKLLSVRLRETNAAFKSTADELVTVQVALEKETIEKQIVVEQIQAETRQLISDQKRRELQSRVKSVVRTLGKEALHQKMEALHTRVMTAEHHMRAAQLEVVQLKKERYHQQQRLEEILTSREIKYHCLAASDGGVPGILQRGTTLHHSTRTVNDQYLLVHMLYEDTRKLMDPAVEENSNQAGPPSDLDDGYCIHILVYDAVTAQDDYLTFHLRDIWRLVPDAPKYLARFADRKHERYQELAEFLFAKCHIGYKNGHIVLTERATSHDEAAGSDRQEIPIYRGSRYLREVVESGEGDGNERLVDLVVNEVYNPATSQLWWLEVQATSVDWDAASNQGQDSQLTIDSQLLKGIIATFAAYRPSESVHAPFAGGVLDEQTAFGIHEDLLEPLFERLQWRRIDADMGGEVIPPRLVLVSSDGFSILAGKLDDDNQVRQEASTSNGNDDAKSLSPCPFDQVDALKDAAATIASSSSGPRVLDHRSIVNVENAFYCVRIQEVWDGELMLHLTMEEPDDSTHRHELVVRESEIESVAAYLYAARLCDADHSASIKYGLPSALHDPICRVIKKHASPLKVSTKPKRGEVQLGRISLDSLFQAMEPAGSTCKSSDRATNECTASSRLLKLKEGSRYAEAIIIGDDLDDVMVEELVASLSDAEKRSSAHKSRIGCRSTSSPAFAVATSYSGFPASFADVLVIDVYPLAVASTSASDMAVKPQLVISRRPIRETLDVVGVRLAPHVP